MAAVGMTGGCVPVRHRGCGGLRSAVGVIARGCLPRLVSGLLRALLAQLRPAMSTVDAARASPNAGLPVAVALGRAQAPVRHHLTARLAVAFFARSFASLIPAPRAHVPVVAPGADVGTACAPR